MSTAWAQSGAPTPGAPSMSDIFVPAVAVLGIFYFLVMRPEQRRRKELETQVSSLKRNDQVVFASGLHGRVMALGEKVLSIEIAPKVTVQVDRDSVQRVLTAPPADGREKERDKS